MIAQNENVRFNKRKKSCMSTGKETRKLHNTQGFSLAELLIALMLSLMSFTLVCTAITAAWGEQKKQTMQSEATMLCQTLTVAATDELRYANNIEGTDIDSIVYTNSKRAGNATKAAFINKTAEDDRTLTRIVISNTLNRDQEYLLVPNANYTQGTKATLELNWHTDAADPQTYHTFTGTVIVSDSNDRELARQSFAVKPVNYD